MEKIEKDYFFTSEDLYSLAEKLYDYENCTMPSGEFWDESVMIREAYLGKIRVVVQAAMDLVDECRRKENESKDEV